MEGYVYLLKSKNKKWHYIGSTKDLVVRFRKHSEGLVRSTKSYRPLKLIYYEAYSNIKIARKREYELKNNNYQKEILFERLKLV